ncbi:MULTISPECIES: hypothetical protein [Streptomyces]|uniref:hypothetical protein n=1 Tax=Streptomyces TaxID=1883 RepID=UPI0019896DB0|nr:MULTISPECIES: hypothetical protein [Streptomyces]GGS85123.1 hypothetical protein GCM10010286_07370 [Streptomyces toxytricini]
MPDGCPRPGAARARRRARTSGRAPGVRAAALLALWAAAACLAGCAGTPTGGYTASGAAAPGPERRAGDNVAPRGPVEYRRLGDPPAADGPAPSAAAGTGAGAPGSPSAGGPGGGVPGGGGGVPAGLGGVPGVGGGGSVPPRGHDGQAPPAPGPSGPAPGIPPGSPPAPAPGTPPPPASPPAPAYVTVGSPARAPAADRWCEQVTVRIANTGGTAVRSGTITFETHVIGALGIDWATVRTSRPLPAPLAGGTARTQTYTVCLDAWRVPLGMHVEIRRATAAWS